MQAQPTHILFELPSGRLPSEGRRRDRPPRAFRYIPGYVAEANKALEAVDHPDKERLTGIGERLQRAMDALDRLGQRR